MRFGKFIERLAIRAMRQFLAPRDSRDSRFNQPCSHEWHRAVCKSEATSAPTPALRAPNRSQPPPLEAAERTPAHAAARNRGPGFTTWAGGGPSLRSLVTRATCLTDCPDLEAACSQAGHGWVSGRTKPLKIILSLLLHCSFAPPPVRPPAWLTQLQHPSQRPCPRGRLDRPHHNASGRQRGLQ